MVILKFKKDGGTAQGELLGKFNQGYLVDFVGEKIYVPKKDVVKYVPGRKRMRFRARALGG